MPEQNKSEETRRTPKQEPQKDEQSESSDLKEREYRDSQGQVHHHTKKYMEQHEGEEASEKATEKEEE